jgi:hypothetical protein
VGDLNEPGLGKSGMTRMEDAIPATRASTDAIATAVPRRRPQVMRAPAPATTKTVAEAGPRGGRGGADAAAAAAADGDGRRRWWRRGGGWNRSDMLPFYLGRAAPAARSVIHARRLRPSERRRPGGAGPTASGLRDRWAPARVVRASTHQPQPQPARQARACPVPGPRGVCWTEGAGRLGSCRPSVVMAACVRELGGFGQSGIGVSQVKKKFGKPELFLYLYLLYS